MADQSGFEHPDLDMPEGAIPLGSICVAPFLDEDGRSRYAVSTKGDLPMITWIGLLEAAKRQVFAWNDEQDD